MKGEFVTKILALKMKELGFNEPCLAYYLLDGMFIDSKILKQTTSSISAPTWQRAFEWFMEKHELYGTISLDRSYGINGQSPSQSYHWLIESFTGLNYRMGIEWEKVDDHRSITRAYSYYEARLLCLITLCNIAQGTYDKNEK